MSHLENKMHQDGKTRFQLKVQKAKKNRYETILPGQNALVKKCVSKVADKIQEFVEHSCSGEATRHATVGLALKDMEADVIAVIVCKFLMNRLHEQKALTTLSIKLSQSLDMERNLQTLADDHQSYYDFMTRHLKQYIMNPHLVQAIVIKQARKKEIVLVIKQARKKEIDFVIKQAREKGIDFVIKQARNKEVVLVIEQVRKKKVDFVIKQAQKKGIALVIKQARNKGIALSEERETSDHLHIGQKLIEIFAEATGFISIEKRISEKSEHPQYTVLATTEALDFIKKIHQQMELMSPVFGPITQKPEPRTSMEEGGFETLPTLLVKNRSRKALEAAYKDYSMPNVYAAINAIQSTPYTINKRVYEVASTLWERKLTIAGLPEHYDKRKHEQSKSFKLRDREELRGKNLATMLTFSVAKEYLEEEAFYFVHTLDFRGRAYPVTSHLSPQGNDLNKGLLTFAVSQGKPLGQSGVWWLAIHGANCYGKDKLSLEERVAWVTEHQARILKTARDPFSDYWWTEADRGKKAFQFLAFCFEWAGYCEQGELYVCALPVAVDGSSNVLQHHAALLKDKELGTRVNMVPLPKPNDIYQEICDKLIVKIQGEIKSHGKKRQFLPAKHWVGQLNRSVLKQPIMTYYYGSKYRGTRQQIEKQVREQKLVFPKDKDGKDTTTQCITWLTSAIRKLIPQEIPAGEAVMKFLQDVAKACCKAGKPIVWTTPSGFKVVLDEIDTKPRQVRTQLFGTLIQLTCNEIVIPPVYSSHKQTGGISANFIHSLDASAMVMCVKKALPKGIKSFRMIHDGFATVPGDMELFVHCIRKSFLTMYDESNLLRDFALENLGKDHPLVASSPKMGKLYLEQIVTAHYFFA